MVSTSFFRCLRVITTLGLIALAPAGCGDPCRDCSNIACSGSDIDCTRGYMSVGRDQTYSKREP